MNRRSTSIRTFIGSENFSESRGFYKDLGFQEGIVLETMSYFRVDDTMGFYLQDYYVKDWIENSMIFLEVPDVDNWYEDLLSRNLTEKFKSVRLSEVKDEGWGRTIYLTDPAGVLWHIATFNAVEDSSEGP